MCVKCINIQQEMSLERSRKYKINQHNLLRGYVPNQGGINDYGSAGAGSKNTPRGLDLPSELRWRSTGRSSEGSEKWILVAKAERNRTDVAMYQYGSDGLPQRIPIWELIQHRFGFCTRCRSFVGGSPFPQKSRKHGEIFEAREHPVPKPKTKQLTGEKRSCQWQEESRGASLTARGRVITKEKKRSNVKG